MKKFIAMSMLLWVMKGCFALDDVTNFLNSLPKQQALTAKVVAINSQRSFMGALSTPYYVWYNKDLI